MESKFEQVDLTKFSKQETPYIEANIRSETLHHSMFSL